MSRRREAPASEIPTLRSEEIASELPAPGTALVAYYRQGAVVHPCSAGAEVVVGRSEPSDLILDDPSLSRRHARFHWRDQELWVEDLGSTNGTRVGGKKVREHRLRADDVVWLGSVAVSSHAMTREDMRGHGVDSYDRFAAALEEEVLRARTFERSTGLVFLRAAPGTDPRLDRACPRLRDILRPVYRMGLYGPTSLVISVAEGDEERTEELAERARSATDPPMLCGWATFPERASSAEELLAVARDAAQRATGRRPVVGAPRAEEGSARDDAGGKPLVVSAAMKRVFALAKQVARSDIPVIVCGETGVGKELVARAIHEGGPRRRGPLSCVNCGAIPQSLIESVLFGHERGAFTGADQTRRGLFETARGGTLFLDEVGELSPQAQAALLRVLETKRLSRVGSSGEIDVDVRILAATHRQLDAMVREGAFRQDLLYRLNSMVIEVPPLRERREEILPLAERFARRAARANGRSRPRIDEGTAALLRAHRWPGNVRELRSVVERAVILALDDVITAEELPERLRSPASGGPAESAEGGLRGAMEEVEERMLLDALAANDWNQSRTAKALGMPRRTLVHKLRRYGIRRKDLGG